MLPKAEKAQRCSLLEEFVGRFISVDKSIVEAEEEGREELHEDRVEEKNPCSGPHVPQCIPSISLRIRVALVETDLSHELTNAGDNNCED